MSATNVAGQYVASVEELSTQALAEFNRKFDLRLLRPPAIKPKDFSFWISSIGTFQANAANMRIACGDRLCATIRAIHTIRHRMRYRDGWLCYVLINPNI